MIFKNNSNERLFNLEHRIKRIKKLIMKKDYRLDEAELDRIIEIISDYHIQQFKDVPSKLYNGNADLLDVAKESQESLLRKFNMNNLYKILNQKHCYEIEEFNINDDFRRNVMYASLNRIIEKGGKGYGAEYGLIFAKAFNFYYDLPIRYASYDDCYSPRFKKFVETYRYLGGSTDVYILPYYYTEDNKQKYLVEELNDIIRSINEYNAFHKSIHK